MQDHFRVTQTFKRVQDRYNFSVSNVLLRAFRSPTVPQNQRDTLTELALGARGSRFESGLPDRICCISFPFRRFDSPGGRLGRVGGPATSREIINLVRIL
jgi:hypothetical protein